MFMVHTKLVDFLYPQELIIHNQMYRPSGNDIINGTKVFCTRSHFSNNCLHSDTQVQTIWKSNTFYENENFIY